MLKNRPVRIIKREQRGQAAATATAQAAQPQPAVMEREVKTVVSGWVSEHRRRADEFRRSYADLLKGAGFSAALSTARG
jgi:hypothetical protein